MFGLHLAGRSSACQPPRWQLYPRSVHISELARRSGMSARTVRFYADRGVIAPQQRTEGGYRVFGERAIRQLRFVQRMQRLGLELDEIAALLRDADRLNCGQSSKALQARLGQQLEALEMQMRELSGVRDELHHLLAPTTTSCDKELCLCADAPTRGRRTS